MIILTDDNEIINFDYVQRIFADTNKDKGIKIYVFAIMADSNEDEAELLFEQECESPEEYDIWEEVFISEFTNAVRDGIRVFDVNNVRCNGNSKINVFRNPKPYRKPMTLEEYATKLRTECESKE